MYEEKIIPPKKAMPQAQDGTLRKFALRVPEVIYQCSGIMVFGKRIKSLVFSTDLSIIKNVNADAIIAVYPFTPQPIITQALLLAADIPVFAGVGGGLTQGQRVVNLAMFAEMQGATGVVVNAPTELYGYGQINRLYCYSDGVYYDAKPLYIETGRGYATPSKRTSSGGSDSGSSSEDKKVTLYDINDQYLDIGDTKVVGIDHNGSSLKVTTSNSSVAKVTYSTSKTSHEEWLKSWECKTIHNRFGNSE